MTFLNPFILFGLAAAAIPILLHLFNLRKLRTIEFSTLSFLKELQKTKIRRLKIRQLLLLLLRTLLIIFVVLAFSRPTLRGSIAAGLGTQAKTTAVFIVDNSLSMTASDEKGELLKQAKDAALAAVDLLKEEDDVALLLLSEENGAAAGSSSFDTRNFVALKSAIREIHLSPIHRKLEDALRRTSKILAASFNFNKEVYVFSDFQAGSVSDKSAVERVVESLFPPEVRFYFVKVGDRPAQNLGVHAVTMANTIFEPGRAFTIQARIGNYTSMDVKNHAVSIFLSGVRVAQRGVDIQAKSMADVEFQVTPTSPGYLEAFVELEDDDLPFDNRRYFTVHVPDRIRVLLVGSAKDLRYVRLALETRQSTQTSTLEMVEARPEEFSTRLLNATEVVILASAELSPAQVDQLGSFLRSGGGLIFFPTSQLQPSTFNRALAAPLKLPEIKGKEGSLSAAHESFTEFERVEVRHPLFQGIFETSSKHSRDGSALSDRESRRSIESPKIRMTVHYAGSSQSIHIITLANRAPFLLEQPGGDGRVLLFSVAPDLDWSDFPLRGLFVPLLHRSLMYLSQSHQRLEPEIAGNDRVIQSRRHGTNQWLIENPEKLRIAVTPRRSGGVNIVHFQDTDLLGIYTVQSANTLIQKFAVNIDPDESIIAPADEPQLLALLERLGIPPSSATQVKDVQDLQRAVLTSRFGVELWKYFILGALILALVEMLIAREARRSMRLDTSTPFKDKDSLIT